MEELVGLLGIVVDETAGDKGQACRFLLCLGHAL